ELAAGIPLDTPLEPVANFRPREGAAASAASLPGRTSLTDAGHSRRLAQPVPARYQLLAQRARAAPWGTGRRCRLFRHVRGGRRAGPAFPPDSCLGLQQSHGPAHSREWRALAARSLPQLAGETPLAPRGARADLGLPDDLRHRSRVSADLRPRLDAPP